MNLYLVAFIDENGDNWDLFVWALTPQQAKDLWLNRFEWQVMPEGAKVFLVPTQAPAQPRVLKWFGEVREVTP